MYQGFILNYVLAWVAILLSIFLCTSYFLRKGVQKTTGEQKRSLIKIKKSFKWPHIWLGFGVTTIAAIHGFYSSTTPWSINIGTISWLPLIALGLSWIFKRILKRRWLRLHGQLTLIFILLTVWHVVDVGGINFFRILAEIKNPQQYEIAVDPDLMVKPPGINIEEPKETPPEQVDVEEERDFKEEENKKLDYFFAFKDLDLTDGTYTGEAYGYSPRLRVEVKIASNMVTGIKILSHMEVDSGYYDKPMKTIPKEILEKQALEVDVISGASLTSFGIINAVREAVLEAGGY